MDPAPQPSQSLPPGRLPYAATPRLSPPRVARHLQVLSMLWLAFGAYRLLSGLLGMFFLSAFATHAWGPGNFPFGSHGALPPSWMAFLLPVIATTTAVSAVLAFVSGYGLITRRSWGRVLAIIAAVLALFKFPIGTVLGVYTLWVLALGQSGAEYDAIAAASPSVR